MTGNKDVVGMKIASLSVIYLILTSMFYLALIILPENVKATTLFVGGSGPGNYTAIQTAIDDARLGDTVYVYNGTYHERLTISKTISLVGEGRDTTTIDTRSPGDVVYVDADWVSITGFTLIGTKLEDSSMGVVLYHAKHCHISKITVTHSDGGIVLDSAHYNTLSGNNVSDNISNIPIRDSNNNVIINNTVSDGMYGISLVHASDNTVTDNTVFGNGEGIRLLYSDNNTVTSNNASTNYGYGIDLTYSRNNMISDNTVSSNLNSGIFSVVSENNVIIGNFVSDNKDGIALQSSSNNTLSNNELIEDGIYLYGDSPDYWNTHVIDNTNSVNGKPVYYWKNVKGGTIPSSAGQVILANCSNVIVENQNVSNGSGGILVGYSSYNTLTNNAAFSNDKEGILLYYSTDSTITSNIVSDNEYGILLWKTNNTTIADNKVSNNKNGISLRYSHHNTIVYNSVYLNRIGAYLGRSGYNTIYYNNFINNTYEAWDRDINSWNYGYPWGGNYWSNFTSSDEKGGPNQDQPGGDGIGDEPFRIMRPFSSSAGPNRDRYPLVKPVAPSPRPPLPPRNLQATEEDQRVILTWSPPAWGGGSPIAKYRVYRGNASAELTFIVEIENVFAYADVGVTNWQTYYYSLSAMNGIGEGIWSSEVAATPKNKHPSCTITTPSPGATVSGRVTISGTSFDTDGTVQEVVIWFDNGPLREVTGTATWSYEWDTTSLPNGNYTMQVVSYDGRDYSFVVNVTVTVDNPKQVWPWMETAIAVLSTIVIILLLYILATRRKKEPETRHYPEARLRGES